MLTLYVPGGPYEIGDSRRRRSLSPSKLSSVARATSDASGSDASRKSGTNSTAVYGGGRGCSITVEEDEGARPEGEGTMLEDDGAGTSGRADDVDGTLASSGGTLALAPGGMAVILARRRTTPSSSLVSDCSTRTTEVELESPGKKPLRRTHADLKRSPHPDRRKTTMAGLSAQHGRPWAEGYSRAEAGG